MLVFYLTITWVLIFGALMQFFHIVTATLIYLLIVALAGVGITVFTNPFNKNTEHTKRQKALKKFINDYTLIEEKDIERQNYIIKQLNCEFYRYNEKLDKFYKAS